MLFKVLIVDDDIVVRINLKTLINWNKSGFEVCGEAANGAEAIQKMEQDEYHIIITDISMPIMDGIALIEHIEQKCPAIKVIALSGYDDFDYVRMSLKSGAIDYILKHKLDTATLLNVLEVARRHILANQQNIEQLQKQQEQIQQSRLLLTHRFISQLIKGLIVDKLLIQETIQSLHLKMDMRNLVVITAEIDGFLLIEEKNLEIVIQSFLNISEEVLKEFNNELISYIENGRFVIIASIGKNYSHLYIHNQLIQIVDRIKLSIRRYLSLTVSFGISEVCEDICDIKNYYDDAIKALKHKFYMGKGHVIWNRDKAIKETFLSLNIKDEKKIIEELKLRNENGVFNQIDLIFKKITDEYASYKSVQLICAELVSLAGKAAKELGIGDSFASSYSDMPYDELKKYDTLEDIKGYVCNIYEKLMAMMPIEISEKFSLYTKKVIEYINRNYHIPISLTDAAEYVGVSSQYLSTIFKEELGMNFTEYLSRLRISHAKTLIESGENKLKDIVVKVGFNNYNYFLKVFKDIVGLTPMEYEKHEK